MSVYEKNVMTQEDDEISIDLLEIVNQLWKASLWIVLSGLLFAILGIIYTKAFVTPMYQSTTKMYVLTKTEGNVTYNDLITGSQLTKDYIELIKSRQVLEQTIHVLNLDTTPAKLQNKVSVVSPPDTRIISISVRDAEPKRAKQIADTLRELSSISIKEITAADAVNTVEEGNIASKPITPKLFKNVLVSGLIGFFLMVFVVIIRSILDDTIKTAEDVEKYLGLFTLTRVPNITEKMTKNAVKRKEQTGKRGNKI